MRREAEECGLQRAPQRRGDEEVDWRAVWEAGGEAAALRFAEGGERGVWEVVPSVDVVLGFPVADEREEFGRHCGGVSCGGLGGGS